MLSGEWEFHDRWPKMEPTVRCSNMMCRSIVRSSNAFQSADCPSSNCCEKCVVQLETPMEDWIRTAPGPDHRFRVSDLLYESQGTRQSAGVPTAS